MMNELDMVVLTEDVPEHGLKAGDVGTIVLVHAGANAFEVEFATLAGDTVAVLTLSPTAIRAFREREIAHVREVA